jgi:cation diffusion facilitator family transporter
MTEHHPAHRGIVTTLTGIVINIFLALTKGIAGYIGNSYVLIADAIESLSDVVSSLIVLGGLRIAAKPRDENHPYGHGKAEPIAAMVVSVSLLGAAVTIVVQSIYEIIIPHHAPEPFTLLVLVVVIAIKESLFRFVFSVGTAIESTVVKTDAWHHRSDAITSATAFLGISIALIGGKGFESADDYAALIASVIIAFNAYRMFRPALDEVMDVAPPPQIEERIRSIASGVPGVLGLDKCLVRKMGFEYYVDLHVIVDGNVSVKVGHLISHHVKDTIMHTEPRVGDVLIHIEPSELL